MLPNWQKPILRRWKKISTVKTLMEAGRDQSLWWFGLMPKHWRLCGGSVLSDVWVLLGSARDSSLTLLRFDSKSLPTHVMTREACDGSKEDEIYDGKTIMLRWGYYSVNYCKLLKTGTNFNGLYLLDIEILTRAYILYLFSFPVDPMMERQCSWLLPECVSKTWAFLS